MQLPYEKNILYNYTKEEEFMQLLLVLNMQARHQFFIWKLETRRGNPIRTTNPLREIGNS